MNKKPFHPMTVLWLGIFFVLFTLKLVGTIDWSWWWITASLWAPVLLSIFFYTLSSVLTWIGRALMTPEQRKQQDLADALKAYSGALQRRDP